MKARHLSSRIGGAILGLTLLLGISAGLSTTAHAQGRYGNQDRRNRNWDGYPNWGGSFDLRQTALNAGYNEGIKEGRNDRRRGRQTDFRNLGAYQKATQDYSSRLGDRELYRRYYREGFENGYADGYNGN